MKLLRTFSKTAFLLSLLIVATLVACKDDDEPQPTEDKDPIIGTWQVVSITPEAAGTTIPELALIPTIAPCITSLKLTFNADNSLTTKDCDVAVTFIGAFVPINAGSRWKVDGNKLTLSNGNTSKDFNYTRTDTELKVVVNTNTDATKPAVNAVLTFKRV